MVHPDMGVIASVGPQHLETFGGIENVVSTDHCVVLGKNKAQAMLTEHLTAALAFCGIDSIDISMDEMEVPALDGSSKQWVELFKSVGIDR